MSPEYREGTEARRERQSEHSSADASPEMRAPGRSVGDLQRIEPLDPAAAAKADQVLNAKTKQNNDLLVLNAKWATNPDLKASPNFDYRKKLVMAEVLRLVADSLDPEKKKNLELAKLNQTKKQVKAAICNGMGQALKRLRPMETMATHVVLWRANGSDPKARTLPKGQTALLLGPNLLIKQSFQKVVEHEMKASNFHIARGEYRSFMFLPLEKLEGESMSLIPYMRMAGKYHSHVVGSMPVDNNLDSLGKLKNAWKFSINSVGEDEQDTLSNATIVANNMVVRKAFTEYHEAEPLTVGLNYAFAAQMTKYFQREKKGHWFIPLMHPKIKPTEMTTVNTVNRLDNWRDAVSSQLNFAYTTNTAQDSSDAGVRIYGASTTFPEEAVDIDQFGNQAVPLIQSQARVTKNRIYYFLVTELERYVGGQESPTVIRTKVSKYLDDMKNKKQIKGWKIVECEKSETGKYSVKVAVKWSAAAEEFEIDAESREEVAGEE
jgi:hypothetical protein